MCLSVRLTRPEDRWWKLPCLSLWKFDVRDSEKGGVWTLWFHSPSCREPRLREVGNAIHALFFSQAALGPRGFSLHYRGAMAPNEPSPRNGSGCIWSQPIKQMNEQFASHIWTKDLQQRGPEAQQARVKMQVAREEKAPREISCTVKKKEGAGNIGETGIPQSSFASSHTYYGGTMKALLD